jgi:MOSC domain-containing protein YiiM
MVATVHLICVRKGDGVHECPSRVWVTVARGVEGDRWYTSAKRDVRAQVTLMSARVAARLTDGRMPLHTAGDNFLVDLDLGEAAMPVGTRLRVGAAVVEISDKPHMGCKKFAARFGDEALNWVNADESCALRLRGVNCRVIVSGEVAVGDRVDVLADDLPPKEVSDVDLKVSREP